MTATQRTYVHSERSRIESADAAQIVKVWNHIIHRQLLRRDSSSYRCEHKAARGGRSNRASLLIAHLNTSQLQYSCISNYNWCLYSKKLYPEIIIEHANFSILVMCVSHSRAHVQRSNGSALSVNPAQTLNKRCQYELSKTRKGSAQVCMLISSRITHGLRNIVL